MARAEASEVKRSDDNEETIMKRLDTFKNQSEPVIASWVAQKKAIMEIDATGEIADIQKATITAFAKAGIINQPKIIFVIGGPGAGKGT